MKRLLTVLAILVLWPTVAGAATRFTLPPRPVYGMFGNDVESDCTEVASANLTIHEFPGSKVTTAQVESAYQITGGWTAAVLTQMETTGFGGHTIKSYYPIISDLHPGVVSATTESKMIVAANAGGVWAEFYGPTPANHQWSHAVAVIGANATGVTFVTGGEVVSQTWATWNASVAFAYGLVWA